jgi:hypothetical protein
MNSEVREEVENEVSSKSSDEVPVYPSLILNDFDVQIKIAHEFERIRNSYQVVQ